jgi:hypothetical protein
LVIYPEKMLPLRIPAVHERLDPPSCLPGEISPIEFLHRPNGCIFVHSLGVAAAFEADPSWQRRTLPDGVGATDRKPKTVCDFIVVDPGQKYRVIVSDGDGLVHSSPRKCNQPARSIGLGEIVVNPGSTPL